MSSQPTGRATMLMVLIAALFFLGLATLNGGVIALALPLLIYLGLALWQQPDSLRVEGNRAIQRDRITEGQTAQVRLDLVNRGGPVHCLEIADDLPAGLEVTAGATRLFTALHAGESAALEFTVRGRRGAYRFHPLLATTADPFDLFRRRTAIAAPGGLLVQPPTQKLRSIPIRPPRTRGFAGPIAARQGGAGVGFFGLREYQLGDRLRTVNWRVTARHDERIFSNVYEQERIADIGLILDSREQNDIYAHDGTLFEHAVRATASLAEAFLHDGNRVGLLVYGSGIEGVFPGYGHLQRDRILRALGRAVAGHHFVFEKLDRLPTRFFPPQSQIVFVGSVMRDDVAMLSRLHALGYGVMVVSPDPIAFELRARPALQTSARGQYAVRIARVERRLNLQTLARHGVQVVDWDVDVPLDRALRTALAGRPIARRPLMRMQ